MNRFFLKALLSRHIRRSIYFSFIIFFISCSPVRRIAKQFTSSRDSINILLLRPENIFKKNLKFSELDLPDSIKDYAGLEESLILKNIDDSLAIDKLFSGIKYELRNRKFRIYSEENMNDFLKLDSNAYIFNLVQIEIDEYTTPYTVSQVYDTTNYYKNFELNNASLLIWFEASQLNSNQSNSNLLFSADSITDDIEGRFKKAILSNEIKYVYKRKNICVDDLYDKIAGIAETNASYIYDYLLNKFINKKYTGNKFPKYYHYDKKQKIVYPAKYKRFIFM